MNPPCAFWFMDELRSQRSRDFINLSAAMLRLTPHSVARPRAPLREYDALCADTASGLEHGCTFRVAGVVMKQVGECRGLVVKPLGLALCVAMHVFLAQCHPSVV